MGWVRLEAITWERLGDALAERLAHLKPGDDSPWLRIAVDGAPAAQVALASSKAPAANLRSRFGVTADSPESA